MRKEVVRNGTIFANMGMHPWGRSESVRSDQDQKFRVWGLLLYGKVKDK